MTTWMNLEVIMLSKPDKDYTVSLTYRISNKMSNSRNSRMVYFPYKESGAKTG